MFDDNIHAACSGGAVSEHRVPSGGRQCGSAQHPAAARCACVTGSIIPLKSLETGHLRQGCVDWCRASCCGAFCMALRITIEFTFATARSCPRHLHPDHNHNHVIRSGVLHHVTQSHHITHPQASSTDVERAEQHKNQGRTESHHITHTMSHAWQAMRRSRPIVWTRLCSSTLWPSRTTGPTPCTTATGVLSSYTHTCRISTCLAARPPSRCRASTMPASRTVRPPSSSTPPTARRTRVWGACCCIIGKLQLHRVQLCIQGARQPGEGKRGI